MFTRLSSFLLCLTLALAASAQEPASPTTLVKIDNIVQDLVDTEQIVGAEVLIIQGGKTLLHDVYGWRDIEDEVPMQLDSVFCVRSMTKPFIGASIMMLVEEGKIELDAPAYKYLAILDADPYRMITVRHLLHHLAGFPMSLIQSADLKTLKSIQEVAALGVQNDLIFPPGIKFRYSDHGTDTLTALLEVVSGMPAEDFVRTRLLEPLGMIDSIGFLPDGHPLHARAASKYIGGPGSWSRYWKAGDPSIFPIFLGSQSMYSTLPDYARFAQLFLHGGKVGEQTLLSQASIDAILSPGPFPMNGPTGLPGARTEYGKLMQLWTVPTDDATEEAGRKNLAYGHTGSDGTHCWVFPEHDAIALYFTQSRGTMTGIQFEELLGELFLGIEIAEVPTSPPAADYLGYYFEGGNDRYRAIIQDGEGIAMEILGKGVAAMEYVGEDSWRLAEDPSTVVDFQRNDEGKITGYRVGDHEEFRFEPSAELPSAEELAKRSAQVHGFHLLKSLGPLNIVSDLAMPSVGLEGTMNSTYAWPRQFRLDANMGAEFEHVAYDGEVLSYESVRDPAGPMQDKKRAYSVSRDQHFARFGDWTEWHETLVVVQKVKLGERQMYLVRTGDCSTHARTLYVEVETGRVLGEDSFANMPGMGLMGQKIRADDFREVEGMLLPYRVRIEFANSMLGRMTAIVTDVKLGVEAPAFRLGG
jgi:CubicO group peptidase (beta-lactamase class C family)